MVTLLFALGCLLLINRSRIAQVEEVSRQVAVMPAPDAGSPTGYAGGLRLLMAPGGNVESYQWVMQTQQMVADGAWRLRHVTYDNAPEGRPVYSASLYRWWLGLGGWGRQVLNGEPTGLAIERFALWSDPLLLMGFLLIVTVVVARQLGPLSAGVFALMAVSIYPFGGVFVPGAPDDVGLSALLVASLGLCLVIGLRRREDATALRRWFGASAVVAAVGLWSDLLTMMPVLLGLAAGGVIVGWKGGPAIRPAALASAWRRWGNVGAGAVILLWLIEYAPEHLQLGRARLNDLHPLYAVVWWGLGEILALAYDPTPNGPSPKVRRIRWSLASAAVLALPIVLLLTGARGFLLEDTFAHRLTALPPLVEAVSTWAWIEQDPNPWRVVLVLAPLSLLIPFGVGGLRRAAPPGRRLCFGVLAGALVVAVGFAFVRLSWWVVVDALLLVVVAVMLSEPEATEPRRPAAWYGLVVGLVVLTVLPAFMLLIPPMAAPSQVGRWALAERELAHWLARRSGSADATVLAPPNLAVSAIFHGGLSTLGSPYRENQDGFLASVRLAGATVPDEANALVRQRQVTHLVIPSWDRFLDEYARIGAAQPEHSLISLLHRWLPPRWLRPVPYYLPNRPEFAAEQVVLFEVTPVQSGSLSLSRLTEYFLDIGRIDIATVAARALARDYEADVGAQVARARTEMARRDPAAFLQVLADLQAGLREGGDDTLAWDQRVSLSLVLAAADQMGLAKEQAGRVLDDLGERQLRSLPEATLFRFLALCHALDLRIEDPETREYARSLLPPELREGI
jgi:hypothetical protein